MGRGHLNDLQPQSHLSTSRQIRRGPPDQHLPLASALHLDVLRAGQGYLDPRPHPPGTVGPNQCCGLVRLDSLRHLGWHRNHSPSKDAADRPPRDLLQSHVARPRGLSTLVKGHAGRFPSGRHHLVIPVGDLAHRRRPLGICVCELHLQPEEVKTLTRNR